MPVGFQEFSEVRDYLFGLRAHGAKYGIDRMRLLVARLGHPERAFPVIHVAGTNGKGSTVALLESALRAAGYKTGMFTSPHLVYQGERVQVNREILPRSEIIRYTNQLRPVAEDLGAGAMDDHPSFFEFMTAMGFLRFAESAVDVALVETGLGGRLDATNVVLPALSVITSIGMDHTELLGDTIEQIAAEKAGILKPEVPVVLGCLPPPADVAIRSRAQALGCPVHSVHDRFGPDVSGYPRCGLAGDHQRLNAATAMLALEVLKDRFDVSESTVRSGFDSVVWAGRWDERRVDGRLLVLDATHNEEGLPFLQNQLVALTARTGRQPVVVTGILGERRAAALLPVIARHARAVILLRPKQPRACSWASMEAAIPANYATKVTRGALEDLFPAPGEIAVPDPESALVVTGSIYLIGEVIAALQSGPGTDDGLLQD